MKKRLISFFMIFSMLCTVVPISGAAAQTNADSYADDISVLSALGIYTAVVDEDFGFMPDDTVNADAFVRAALNLRFDDIGENTDVIKRAEDYGFIDIKGSISANGKITLGQAVKLLVRILEYSLAAEARGAVVSEYMNIARRIELMDGVNGLEDSLLTEGNMIKLLVNAADAPLGQLEVYGTAEYKYSKTANETILSFYRDIYKIKGMVTQDSFTGLNDVSNIGDDEAAIDDVVYKAGKTDAAGFLGKNVYAYVLDQNSMNKPEILYITEKNCKNRELTLDAADIVYVSDDCTKLTYKQENSREKSVSLSVTRRVIYNGVIYNDFTAEDIAISSGRVRLLDNDDDGKYDIVFTEHFEITMLVNYISSYERLIYNQYQSQSTVSFEELYEDDNDAKSIIILDGGQIKLTDIEKNDVVSVLRSKNPGKKTVKFYVSRERITGALESFDAEELECDVEKDGETLTYDVNPVFAKELSDPEGKIKELVFGTDYEFCLDVQGKIAGIINIEGADIWRNVLLFRMFEDEFDASVNLKYMDDSGKWYTAKLAQKVGYRDTRYTAEAVYSDLTNGEKMQPQLAQIRLSSEGTVKAIRTAALAERPNKNLLTRTQEQEVVFRPSSSFDYKIFLEQDAKVFVMPMNVSYNQEDYYVTGQGYFSVNSQYSIVAYNMDKYSFTGLVSVKDNTSKQNIGEKAMFLVTKVKSELNADGDVVRKIYGSMGNYTTISAEAAHDNVFDGIRSGDVVQILTDIRGKVTRINRIFSFEEGNKTHKPSDYIADHVNFAANVQEIDAANGRMLVSYSDGTLQTVRFSTNTSVTLYDAQTRLANKVKVNDIKPGDFIVVKMSYVSVNDIIVIKF